MLAPDAAVARLLMPFAPLSSHWRQKRRRRLKQRRQKELPLGEAAEEASEESAAGEVTNARVTSKRMRQSFDDGEVAAVAGAVVFAPAVVAG